MKVMSKSRTMDAFTENCRLSIKRGLAELFALLGHEYNGIDACWYRLDRFKNETVTPRNGSVPFDNPILPLSTLFQIGKVRTNDMLLACGILTVLKKGNYKGKLGICSKAGKNLRDKFKLKGLMEMEHVTRENLVGTRVWCVQVGSFGRRWGQFTAGEQAEFTKKKQWNPSRIRIKAALNKLFYAISLSLVTVEAVAALADDKNQDERTEEAEAVGICRESGTTGSESAQPTPAAAKNHTFEVNMNAAYKDPVKYKAANGKEQVLL